MMEAMQSIIDIKIQRNLQIPVDKKWFHTIIIRILELEKIKEAVNVSLFIADDVKVTKLNRQYRGIDATTDVLSFAIFEHMDTDLFIMPSDGIRNLGEIIISYPQAVKQSEDLGHDIQHELRFLLVHGMLHLLGYDHEQPEEKRQMRSRENTIVRHLE
ncbi:MAG TPA: rRNA maturation RNase YbeY [Dehalococcoidia bacterium]|nr:rRNA maturation RNase YbeY [Dehalococcoidia bacterium]